MGEMIHFFCKNLPLCLGKAKKRKEKRGGKLKMQEKLQKCCPSPLRKGKGGGSRGQKRGQNPAFFEKDYITSVYGAQEAVVKKQGGCAYSPKEGENPPKKYKVPPEREYFYDGKNEFFERDCCKTVQSVLQCLQHNFLHPYITDKKL